MQLTKPIIISTLLLLNLSCSDQNAEPADHFTGYIEVVNAYMSAPQAGWIEQLQVKEGDKVEQQQNLLKLDSESQQILLQQANAELIKSKEQLENLRYGARVPEVEVVKLQIKEQQALIEEAKHELIRQQQMRQSNATSEAALDRATANYDALKAKQSQLKQQLNVMQLPDREHTIGAAEAQVEAAQQGVNLQQWQLQQRTLIARHSGYVEQIYFRQGEYVTPGTPILSLLLTNQFKVRFYVGQAQLSQLQSGQQVHISNDAGMQGKGIVTFISQQPEFTPPVLYSNDSRDQLVYLVEAKIDDNQFRAGQPVDVAL